MLRLLLPTTRLQSIIALLTTAIVTSDALAQGGPTPVRLDAVRQESVQEMRAITGDVVAPIRADVATREEGIVIEMRVQAGQVVRRDQVIARLDSRRRELEVTQATADRAVIAAEVVERDAERQREFDDLQTVRLAYEQGAANDTELREAKAAFAIAEARLEAAKLRVDAADARISLLQERLDDMTIRAPFDGAIVTRHADLGEWAGAGDPIVEMIATDSVEVWLRVPQRHLSAVRSVTDPVTVNVDATTGERRSTATRIVPLVDPRARTFTLIVTLENKDGALAPGMSVIGWVPTGERRERLTIDKDAVLRNDVGPYVYVMRESAEGPPHVVVASVIEQFPLRDRVVVDSAHLSPGDRIVVEGNERLFPMAPIRPVDPPGDERQEARR